MRIVGFDIGVKNLAYCVFNDSMIERWKILDISGEKDFNATAKRLIQVLHDEFPDPIFDVILIENQPVQKNPVMKSIQMMLYSFFQIQIYQSGKDCDVKLISASNKLKLKHVPAGYEHKSKSDYKNNKAKAIACAQHYLVCQDLKWRQFFDGCKKKDDLSDSMLCIVHYLESQGKEVFKSEKNESCDSYI